MKDNKIDNEEEMTDIPEAEEVKEETKAEKKTEKKKENSKSKKEVDALKKQLEEEKDKYLRMMAEYDNFRKRAQKERESAYTDAYADAVAEILPIIDNLERALGCGGGEKLEEGLKMTLNQFGETLKKLGIEEIPAAPGDEFDPNLHNAVMHTEDENMGENQISQVFAKGYRKGDKVIRHPMVMVVN